MPRFFNTAGPCVAADHYMLPPMRRLPEVRGLIDEKRYFVLHAPRQSGKGAAAASSAIVFQPLQASHLPCQRP